MVMPNAIFRIVTLSALALTTSFLFYTPAQGQTYSVNGAPIEVSLLPEKSVIMLGEPIHLSFIVRNLSETDLRFSEGGDYRNRLGRPESYDVRAVRSDGKQVPKPEILFSMGGLVGSLKAPAGGAATRHLFLPHWAPFEETGTYTITCKKTIHFSGSGALLSGRISVPVQTSVQIEVVGSNQEKMGEIIEKLGAEMLGEDKEMALLASQSLDYINDERTVTYLVKAVDPGDYSLTLSSLRSLGKYNTDSAIEGIKRGMSVSHTEMREAGDRSAAISLAESVRSAAADALAKSKHPEAIPLLISMRKDDYWAVRLTVVQALGELGTPEAMEILQEMSKDKNENVRGEAIGYLSAKEKPRTGII
jgi:HEAT repeat protein